MALPDMDAGRAAGYPASEQPRCEPRHPTPHPRSLRDEPRGRIPITQERALPLRAMRSNLMAQNTATEKDMFLQTFEREAQITLKLLRAFPADQADFRPAEKSRTAKELASIFVIEQGLAGRAIAGTLDFSKGGGPG